MDEILNKIVIKYNAWSIPIYPYREITQWKFLQVEICPNREITLLNKWAGFNGLTFENHVQEWSYFLRIYPYLESSEYYI